MKALILSAGQGSRLLPLTADRPKCLLAVGAHSVLEWQVRHLEACGVTEIVVVVGFRSDAVESALATLAQPGVVIRTVFNPFYKVAENVASCWMARHELTEDFLLLNGDVVFEPAVARTALERSVGPVSVTVNHPREYDADDMKVELQGKRVVAIGKDLPIERVGAESIGMMVFRGDGPGLFVAELERVMRTPEGLKSWFTQVVHRMARGGLVESVSIDGLDWGEIDFPNDLEAMQAVVEAWGSTERSASAASHSR